MKKQNLGIKSKNRFEPDRSCARNREENIVDRICPKTHYCSHFSSQIQIPNKPQKSNFIS